MLWKRVLVKRQAVNQSVFLLTIELSELRTQSECRQHFISVPLTIQNFFLISESIMRIIFPDENDILYTQEKLESLENIMKNWLLSIELFCNAYYIFTDASTLRCH